MLKKHVRLRLNEITQLLGESILHSQVILHLIINKKDSNYYKIEISLSASLDFQVDTSITFVWTPMDILHDIRADYHICSHLARPECELMANKSPRPKEKYLSHGAIFLGSLFPFEKLYSQVEDGHRRMLGQNQ